MQIITFSYLKTLSWTLLLKVYTPGLIYLNVLEFIVNTTELFERVIVPFTLRSSFENSKLAMLSVS